MSKKLNKGNLKRKTLPVQLQIPLIILMSGLCFYFGNVWYQKSSYIVENGINSQATVLDVRVEKKHANHRHTNKKDKFYAIIEYQVQSQLIKTQVSSQGGRGFDNSNLYTGNIIDIIYDPKSPSDVFIPNFMGLWLWPTILFGSAIMIIVIGVAGIIYHPSRNKL